MLDVYDKDNVVAYPLVILNVDVMSIAQGVPPLDDIVVVVIEPLPVPKTQVGNGVHALPTHVIFS